MTAPLTQCPTCKRPAWDGGHALNERECDDEGGFLCKTIRERDALQQRLDAVIAEVRAEADSYDLHQRPLVDCNPFAYVSRAIADRAGGAGT